MKREGSVIRYKGRRGVVWRIRYIDASGRRVIETLGYEPEWTRKLAERALRSRLTDVAREGYEQPGKLEFAEFAERWFKDHLPARNLKPTTVETYGFALQHLVGFFGDRRLSDLAKHPALIDRYVAAKVREGLAPKTVNNHLLTLSVMLKQAVRWKLIHRNPLVDAERPRLEDPDMQVLTESEVSRLWAAYNQLEHEAPENERRWWRLARTITFVGLGTALRRGELLGLRWRDVQLLEGVVQVREAFVRGRFTTPKSRASRRRVELGTRTQELLREHWQETCYTDDDDLVFCHPDGGRPLDPGRLSRRYLRPALKRAGVTKPFRPFHDLRHTALTHEAAAGNPQVYVQLKAGHSQGSITERYIHAAQVLFPGAAQRGEDRLFGALDGARAPSSEPDDGRLARLSDRVSRKLPPPDPRNPSSLA
jgi:integrase